MTIANSINWTCLQFSCAIFSPSTFSKSVFFFFSSRLENGEIGKEKNFFRHFDLKPTLIHTNKRQMHNEDLFVYLFFFFFPSDLPKFGEPLQNITIPVGREALLSCVVDNLQTYKVIGIHFFWRFKPAIIQSLTFGLKYECGHAAE